MGNVLQYAESFRQHWRGKQLVELFPHYILNCQFNHFRPHMVQMSSCPVCGICLTQDSMFPSGRAPRAMCTRCYDTFIVHRINHRCLVSYDPLPHDQIQQQHNNPRELLPNFAIGAAKEYMLWAFNEVLMGNTGVYNNYQAQRAPHMAPADFPQANMNYQHYGGSDFIDLREHEDYEVVEQYPRQLPHHVRQLEEPRQSLSDQEFKRFVDGDGSRERPKVMKLKRKKRW
jgi:hypothetical protein